jgi:hypothetical protein
VPRSARLGSLLYAGATAILVAAVLWVHARQGLSRPVPWPDEASFLWQAIAVQRGNTLFAPQLRDFAHVLWMPPGYMAVTGFAFKLVGFSLETARWLSALFVAAGGVALAAVFRRTRHPFASLLFLAVFLLSPIAVLVANVARMEGLLFALACAALLALQRGWLFAGLALAALLPLVHPIGAFFAGGAGAHVLLAARRDPERRRPRAVEWIALALACAAWAAYAGYVAQHFEQFRADMRFQFGQKTERAGGPLLALARLANPAIAIPCFTVTAGAIAVALRPPPERPAPRLRAPPRGRHPLRARLAVRLLPRPSVAPSRDPRERARVRRDRSPAPARAAASRRDARRHRARPRRARPRRVPPRAPLPL